MFRTIATIFWPRPCCPCGPGSVTTFPKPATPPASIAYWSEHGGDTVGTGVYLVAKSYGCRIPLLVTAALSSGAGRARHE